MNDTDENGECLICSNALHSELSLAVEEQRNRRWMQITDYYSVGDLSVKAISFIYFLDTYH